MFKFASDFLFAKPRALFGVARALDLAGLFDSYNISRSVVEADAKALLMDWYVLGQELNDSVEVVIPAEKTSSMEAKHELQEKG